MPPAPCYSFPVMDWRSIHTKTQRCGVGLMSGSSCDGIDAAVVRFTGHSPSLRVEVIHFHTADYPPDFRARLLDSALSIRELTLLDFDLGRRMGEAAAAAVDAARQKGIGVDFVASHGHTIAHIPPGADPRGVGTLQIGQPAVIAEITGLPVVADFRPRDIAAGGQGAPLVPYADWLLFRRADATAVTLNIGGIANFSVLPPDLEEVTAFDTGPGNMIIDGAMRLLTNGEIGVDKDGAAAARGAVVPELLAELLDHPYFRKPPPKSTGREEFGPAVYLQSALTRYETWALDDILATVTEAVARSIAEAFDSFIAPAHRVDAIIAAGGGTSNPALMRRLAEKLPGVAIASTADYGIPSDAREAAAFAILGHETLCGRPSNAPAATGARRPVILGTITQP